MRRDSFKPQWSMTVLLVAVNIAVFILQKTSGSSQFIRDYLELSNRGISQGYLWQLLTFQFLHGGFFHLLFNCIAIYFFGRMVEERLGKGHFLKIYFISGTVGGLFQIFMGWLIPEYFGIPVLGASAGAFGLLAAATMMEPNLTILAYFFIPLRAKYFLLIAAGFSLFSMIFSPDSPVANAAHLGGMLAGVVYIRWGDAVESFLLSLRPRSRSRGKLIRVHSFKGKSWSRGRGKKSTELAPGDFISQEVDPILDKISAHGIQSLTPQEKQILETARAKMEHRT